MPKVFLTGATGFVGSQIAEVLATAGHDVLVGLRTARAESLPWGSVVVDYNSVEAIEAAAVGSDAIVHCAIDNSFHNLQNNRPLAYDAFVGLTQRVTRAAEKIKAQPIYISTDWVFDGKKHMVPESEPANPINFYGVLKSLGEQVIRDLAPDGAICRIAGVMGQHRLQAENPRVQDVGFGYFVASIVQALRAGKTFEVWTGDGVNAIATPTLASEIGAGIERIISTRAAGTFHLVSSEAIDRMGLAHLTCEVFGLDASKLLATPAPAESRFAEGVPVDSSLSSEQTRKILNLAPTTVRQHLEAFKIEMETGKLHPITQPN